jgi:hypothetical protein
MENPTTRSDRREFSCSLCNGRIVIPWDLPPTTAPCPRCGGMITSPPPVEPPHPVPPAGHVIPRDRAPATLRSGGGAKAGKKDRLAPAIFLLMLALGGAGAVFLATRENHPDPSNTSAHPPAREDDGIREARYIRIGWRKEAVEVLRGFLAARNPNDKLPFILNGPDFAGRVRDFYGDAVIDDSDTPFEGFSFDELSEEDRRRGLFMMTYDQPPQFDMREFFMPLAPLEVQHGIEEPDLMFSTFARASNFAMDPLRVHAFFKRTPGGLKLDWEIFSQTKYRTLRNFIELPAPGHAGVFRVLMMEDVPDRHRDEAGYRTYRIVDPAHNSDSARVRVKVDSEIGRMLSVINWRGSDSKQPIMRTATVELTWTGGDAAPELAIRRFICWEFLGLGGGENSGNTETE